MGQGHASVLVVGTGATREEVAQTWSGPRAGVPGWTKPRGSGAGWLRGIRQRAQVTPLALLARSHLTCPYVNQFVGPPPSLCTSDRTRGPAQRQPISNDR